MRVDFVRHGIAEERAPRLLDAERALTNKGRTKAAAIAARLHRWDWQWDVILTSPLVRARQTAEILQAAQLAAEVEVLEALAPGGEFGEFIRWQQSRPDVNDVALVGHQPDLSCWIELAVWGQANGHIQLKKAGVGRVEFAGGQARLGRGLLLEVLTPKTLLADIHNF
ncbi:MAG: phosphohistidine phosphatase SixA [Cyanobacteria bacterium J06642_2]